MCSLISNISRCFGFNRNAPPAETKVVLQAEFREKILKKAYKIIGDPNYFCPPEVKRHFILKHNLQPGRYRKILNSVCKPTSKVIAAITVEWIVSTALSAVFLSKIIVAVPSMAILGTGYWTTVSVSLISLAVYPVLMISFGAAITCTVAGYHIVANRVHRYNLARRNAPNQLPGINFRVSYDNLMSSLRYDPATEVFWVRVDTAGTEEAIPEYEAASLCKKALQLEKYNILLQGNRTRIQRFLLNENVPEYSNPAAASSSTDSSITLDISTLKKVTRAERGLNQICSNAPIQPDQNRVIDYLIKIRSKAVVAAKMIEFKEQFTPLNPAAAN